MNFGIVSVHEKNKAGNGILLWDLRSTNGDQMMMVKWSLGLFQLLFYTHIVAIDTDWEWKYNCRILLHRDRVKSLQIPQLNYPKPNRINKIRDCRAAGAGEISG